MLPVPDFFIWFQRDFFKNQLKLKFFQVVLLSTATSKNKNLGLIYEISSFKLSTDFWEVKYKNRVEAENAQALLTADPNGPSITRNELGDLVGVTTSYFNEESTLVRGYDIQMSYTADIDFIEDLTFVLKGTKK